MITQLYTFSAGSYVVAEEWNANFRALYNTTLAHIEAIMDTQNDLAFPDSDFSALKMKFFAQPDAFFYTGSGSSITVPINPGEESFVATVSGSQVLTLDVQNTFRNSEARVVFRLLSQSSFRPFNVSNYSSTISINEGRPASLTSYAAGMYYVFLKETNGVLQVKLVMTTGV